MNHRSLFRILAVAMLLLALMLAWLLRQSHDAAVQRAIDGADNLAQALHGQFTATFRRIDSNLHAIAARLPLEALDPRTAPRYRREFDAILQPSTNRFPELGDYFIWDAEGGYLHGTTPASPTLPRPSIAGRPGYQLLQSAPEATLVFSDAVRGIVTDRPLIAIYVPVRDAQGRLRGVVTASLNLDRVMQSFEMLQMPAGSVIFMRRSDSHKLVIRDPQLESEINKPVANAIQRRIDAGENSGRERFRAVTDGEYRLYGFRRIDTYPFYVVVGLAERAALADWRRNVWIVAICLGLMVLALGGAFWRARREERERLAAQHEAAHAHALLQEAINSVSAGMVIYDDQDRFVMCNQAHRALFSGVDDVFRTGQSFETLVREGMRRGLFPAAQGQEEAWRILRLAQHRQADGRAHELELGDGSWVQFSEHRTPLGYTVGIRIDITERKRLEAELRQQASTDALTGLPNRRHLLQRLEEELERVRRGTTREACVLMLDLDHFKRINDQHGHAAGDSLLRHFAHLLRQELRSTDVAGRMGGEEFAVILPGSSTQAARVWAQRICTRLVGHPLLLAGQPVSVTVSVGIAAISPDDPSADGVLTRADRALYQAKQAGRNRVELDAESA